MGQIIGNDAKQEHTREEQSSHGEAGQHGHTGEGAASVLAHLISQAEKHGRQQAERDDGPGSGHP